MSVNNRPERTINNLDEVSPQLLGSILSDSIFEPKDVFHGVVVLINGKVWSCDGQIVFSDEKTAWRAFYGSAMWKIKNRMTVGTNRWSPAITRKQFKDFRERCLTFKKI